MDSRRSLALHAYKTASFIQKPGALSIKKLVLTLSQTKKLNQNTCVEN
jgi:hypothetical protein